MCFAVVSPVPTENHLPHPVFVFFSDVGGEANQTHLVWKYKGGGGNQIFWSLTMTSIAHTDACPSKETTLWVH